jgi:hypothetical protein
MMKPLVTDEAFVKALKEGREKLVVIMYYATWYLIDTPGSESLGTKTTSVPPW